MKLYVEWKLICKESKMIEMMKWMSFLEQLIFKEPLRITSA
jgi:hypothetical protein